MAGQAVSQTKEVRFAVVMYGGVSLAIYINGVAQELYNLVRATATKPDGDGDGRSYLFEEEELGGAGKVYRKLGEMLDARFVVDILSGTSAGGINAVFLAKALANNQPFEGLKRLWIEEGDISKLVNDKNSVADIEGLEFSAQPASLLNSQRMYYKLLEALDSMEPKNPTRSSQPARRSPYVDELDLFVTATDIRGQVRKTRLAIAETAEYRFKNVFRFRYATKAAAGGRDVNDFERKNNPFLAFAARCTSAFPFAFEPMCLGDVKAVVETPAFRESYSYDPSLWAGFYKDYLNPQDGDPTSSAGFEERAFGDGGYLDNKPFSYATETLLRRRADLPVDRKLVYIEPAPEQISKTAGGERPNALENVAAALVTLPRYETIFEDLQSIAERNQVIERAGSILQQIQHASRAALDKESGKWQMGGTDWAKQYLDEKILGAYGPGYAVYHQLRVASLLDELASGLARAMGWEENGEQAWRFRQEILEGWREQRYRIDPRPKDEKDTRRSENDLLFRLDISWRLRRLQFIQRLVDELLAGLEDDTSGLAGDAQKALSRGRQIVAESGGDPETWPFEENPEARHAFRRMLLLVKVHFNEAYKELRAGGRKLRARNILEAYKPRTENGDGQTEADDREAANEQAYVRELRALKQAIESDAGEETIYDRMESLSVALASREKEPQPPAVKGVVRTLVSANAAMLKPLMDPETPLNAAIEQELERTAREGDRSPSELQGILKNVLNSLRYYYESFEYYDMQTLPLTYGTEVGESDIVEIIRISPEDACRIPWDPPKLAGTKLNNFGAFFVREWRENDILWGRLDGAECLIKALLPGEDNARAREELVDQAHEAILYENYLDADWNALLSAIRSGQAGSPQELQEAFTRALAGAGGARKRFQAGPRISLDFPPETVRTISARASRVSKRLFSTLSREEPGVTGATRAIARFGSAINGLVLLALPNSTPNLVFNILAWLLYLAGSLMVLFGSVSNAPAWTTAGVMILALTAAAHIGIFRLQLALKIPLQTSLARLLLRILTVPIALGLLFLVYFGMVYLGWLELPGGALGAWLGNIGN